MGAVRFVKLHPDAKIPTRSSDKSAGLDVYASRAFRMDRANKLYSISTGINISFSEDIIAKIESRSELCENPGIEVSSCVLDNESYGEIKVLLKKQTRKRVWIKKGMVIARLVFHPVLNPEIYTVDDVVSESSETGKPGGPL